jgi:hypothetical protein
VRSGDGAGNVETGAGSYFLWYPDTVLELRSAALNGDGWTVQLTRWMRTPDMENPVTTLVRITGPHGSSTFQTTGFLSNHSAAITLRAENPDGLWDFTDTGTYSLDVATYYTSAQPTGWQPTASYWLWYTNPKVEILSTDFSDSEVLITARFSDDHGIDLSSVRWSSIAIDNGLTHIPPTRELYQRAELQPDGSVIAQFKRGWINATWGNRDNGDWTYLTHNDDSRVRDVDGNPTSAGVVIHQAHTFNRLSMYSAAVSAFADNPTTLSFTLDFWSRDVDLASFGNDDVRLELAGHTYQLTLNSVAYQWTFYDGQNVHRAVYTLNLPQGERFTSGNAAFYLNQGGLTISGQGSPQQLLGSWWLWFN